jgi:hypothetical protein
MSEFDTLLTAFYSYKNAESPCASASDNGTVPLTQHVVFHILDFLFFYGISIGIGGDNRFSSAHQKTNRVKRSASHEQKAINVFSNRRTNGKIASKNLTLCRDAFITLSNEWLKAMFPHNCLNRTKSMKVLRGGDKTDFFPN